MVTITSAQRRVTSNTLALRLVRGPKFLVTAHLFSQFTLNPIRPGTASNLGMKSLLHPMRSTALCSLRSRYSMNMLLSFLFSLVTIVCSLTTASAQNLPNTTRLLRFPTTNDRDIVFCYAGQLYTVGKDGAQPAA